VTTTTWGWPWVVVVTVRLTTRFTGRATVRLTTRFFATVTCFTTRGCWMRSVTYTPPPPITAPPQVQAHSLAKAMRTDIVPTLPVAGVRSSQDRQQLHARQCAKSAKQIVKCNAINGH